MQDFIIIGKLFYYLSFLILNILIFIDIKFVSFLVIIVIFIYIGLPLIGWICNLFAMKLSPISKEEMVRIQGKIAEQKAKVK